MEEDEKKAQREDKSSDEDEFRLEVIQPSGSGPAEEAVTEIEHIHYEDEGTANNDNDTDSDDSD